MAISAAILAVSLGAAMAGLVPVAEAMLAGALLMVLTGCMSMDEAYQAIEWRTIVLVAGMLPVGVALRQSGAAAAIGDWIAGAAQAGGPAALLSALFFFAALLTQVVPGSGAAVPAIVGPIAIETAVRAGADPRAFMLGVALATSTSFMTPFGHPVNAFVMAPGGYRVRDYLVAGAPLAAVTSLVILWALRSFAPVVAR
jgi:di/tricarboxylate transporter